MALLRQLADDGVTILMVEQNVRTALKYANRALVLEMGRLALDRPASELLHDPDLNRLFLGGHAKTNGGMTQRATHQESASSVQGPPASCCRTSCTARASIRSSSKTATAITSSIACARACSSKARWISSTQRASVRACAARACVHHGIEIRFAGNAAKHRLSLADRRPLDHRVRAAGSR